MFSEVLKQYITRGNEETSLEYKGPMPWKTKVKEHKDKIPKVKIIQAILAMANHPNGGVVVVGVKEKKNGEFVPVGLSKRQYDSFKLDHISNEIKNYCSPPVQFKMTRNFMEIKGKKKRFVVFQVSESKEFPVICAQKFLYNKAKADYGDNILLRENAIYIRSRSPIGSREIQNIHEWQELIYRIMERSRRELLRRMPCAEYMQDGKKEASTKKERETKKVDSKKFKDQLKGEL